MAPARMVQFMEEHVENCEICQNDPDVKDEIAKIAELVLPESKIPKTAGQQNQKQKEEEAEEMEENGEVDEAHEETEEEDEEPLGIDDEGLDPEADRA